VRPETRLQIDILAELRRYGVEPIAVPNGAVLAGNAKRRVIQMNSLKKQGLKVGFPDLVALMPFGRVGFIEVKCEGEKLTKKQIEVHEFLLALGHKVVVCRSVEDVRETMAAWGMA
jgi:hypothetical protein